MKIQYMSDLHLEWMEDKRREEFIESLPVVADILVLAGDIVTYSSFVKSMTQFAKKWEHVIHVPGNHEFYGSNRGHINNMAAKVMNRFSNYHYLANDVVEIEGQKFVGSTLWFPENAKTFVAMRQMNDYTSIQGFKKNVFGWNKKCVQFLNENVSERSVVVTHHAPSKKSEHMKYAGDSWSPLYYCELDELIKEKKPVVWFHGHMHDPVNYFIDDTSVLSNPRGYERVITNPDGSVAYIDIEGDFTPVSYVEI